MSWDDPTGPGMDRVASLTVTPPRGFREATTGGFTIPLPGGIDVPVPDLGSLDPREAITEAAEGVIGQTTGAIFAAVMGPIAELVVTGVLAGAGVALIVRAVDSAARRTDRVRQITGAITGGAT